VLVTSFATERSITLRGYSFFPTEFTLDAYKLLITPRSKLPGSYLVTVQATLVGTFIATLITYCAGYALASKQCRYRDWLSLYFFVTMIFSAGLVPWYMVTRKLGIVDTFWALVIPSLLFSPYNMFLVRNFAKTIPDSLHESARMDGAGEVRIAFQIYFPLCLPVLATITLFYAIGYWNNFFNSAMLLNERTDLYSLQMLLFSIQSEINKVSSMAQGVNINPPKESFKMATSILTIGPIILVYPFLQRFFIKGMIIGAVKG